MQKFSELIKKSTEDGVGKKKPAVQKGRFKIAKSDDDKMLAFGWANVSITADGELIEDYQEDIIEPEELESAAYKFAELYREGGEMHERGGVATLVESPYRIGGIYRGENESNGNPGGHVACRMVDWLQGA